MNSPDAAGHFGVPHWLIAVNRQEYKKNMVSWGPEILLKYWHGYLKSAEFTDRSEDRTGLSAMLDSLFRRDNPTNKWSRLPGLTLTIDLLKPSVNGVPVGSAIDELSFLGRSSSKVGSPLDFADLGLSLDDENDGSFSGFQVILEESAQGFSKFSGTITLNRSLVDLSSFLDTMGEPYWIDRDEYESIFFFVFPNHEIQVEQSLAGVNQRIIVTRHPLMADAEQRKAYGVDKAWPPS